MFMKFSRSRSGNIAVMTSVLMIPLAIGAGLAVDYGMATATRSDMQNALDAAAFAALELPLSATRDERAKALQDAYAANGGLGQATMTGDIVSDATGISLKVKSGFDMQTSIMGLVGVDTVAITTTSSVSRPMKLTSAAFQLIGVTGAWDKTVTLMGRPAGQKKYEPLVRMDYVATNIGGWGNTTIDLPNDKNPNKWDTVASISCTALRTCSNTARSGSGMPEVDTSGMDDLSMEMDISAKVGKPLWPFKKQHVTLVTTDADTWQSMFVDGKQMTPGPIDLLKAFGCTGNWVEQRWEDGGGHSGTSAWEGTDFRYNVKGKCSSRTGTVRLTQ